MVTSPVNMVSYETRFRSQQPKLVSTSSETKRLRLASVVSRNNETASFGVMVQPKITTLDAKQL